MSARDDYPHLAEAWGADTARALDEIDRLRAEVARLSPRGGGRTWSDAVADLNEWLRDRAE